MIKLSKNSLVLLELLMLVVSIILFFFAPKHYSLGYCKLLLVLYLISSIGIIKRTIINGNYFNFHILFLLSFFFVNFAYPVFLYPLSVEYFPVFRLPFNHDIITKATALAFVGSSSFNLGISLFNKENYTPFKSEGFNIKTIQILLNILLILLFILMLSFGGSYFLKGYFKSTAHIPPGLTIIFQIVLSTSIMFSFYQIKKGSSFIRVVSDFNKTVLVIYLLFSFFYVFAGDRGPFIQVTLILFFSYTLFVKSLKLKSFIILVLTGMLFLTFIGYARTQHSNDDSVVSIKKGLKYMNLNSFFDITMDLVVNNRNLYVGYDYVEKYGINYGKGLSYQLFAPFPLLPSIYAKLVFNSTPDDLTSGRIITNYSKANYGLGTNLIIDLYMGFGIFGVVIIMFLFGYFVTWIHNSANFLVSFEFIITYIFLISFAVYMPRSYISDPYRPIVWALLIYYILRTVRKFLIQMSNKKV